MNLSVLKILYFNLILPIFMGFPSHIFRLYILRFHLKKLGQNVTVLRNVTFLNLSNISIGDNCVINTGSILDGRGGELIIENNVDIARDVYIWTLQHDIKSEVHISIGNNVLIGKGAWLASRCTILPGVNIGDNAAVATGAVVTKSIPNNVVVGGVPAKEISLRKSQIFNINTYYPLFK